MEGLGTAIAGLIGIGVTAIIFKEFTDPKTGKRTKYELYKTYESKKDAASDIKRKKDEGFKTLLKPSKEGFNLWITEKTSNIMKWPYN